MAKPDICKDKQKYLEIEVFLLFSLCIPHLVGSAGGEGGVEAGGGKGVFDAVETARLCGAYSNTTATFDAPCLIYTLR